MPEFSNETCTQNLERWQDKNTKFNTVLFWGNLVHYIGILIVIIFVIIYLRCKRKKYQSFNVLILLLFLLFNASQVYLLLTTGQTESPSSDHQSSLIFKIGHTAYLFSHWLYVSQYIKTSMILPILFNIGFILLKSRQASQESFGASDASKFIQFQ